MTEHTSNAAVTSRVTSSEHNLGGGQVSLKTFNCISFSVANGESTHKTLTPYLSWLQPFGDALSEKLA